MKSSLNTYQYIYTYVHRATICHSMYVYVVIPIYIYLTELHVTSIQLLLLQKYVLYTYVTISTGGTVQ